MSGGATLSFLGSDGVKYAVVGAPANGPLPVSVQVPSGASGGVTPSANVALASNRTIKTAACVVYGLNVFATVAGYVFVFDSATATGAIKKTYALAAGQSIEAGWNPGLAFVNGCTIGFSSTPFPNYTASATAFIDGEAA